MLKHSSESQDIIFDSKERVLNVASKLFSEFGFLGVSMGDIARELNVSKAALYYHFNSKKELYLQVLDRSFNMLIKTINREVANAKSSNEIIVRLIQGYLSFGSKEKNLIRSLLLKTPDMDSEIMNHIVTLRKKINCQFQNFFEAALKKDFTAKIDLKFISSSLLGIMDRLISETALSNKRLNIKRKALQIMQIIKPALKVETNK
ncbi:hypothetical protein B6D52_03295 [Candidatus Parcubacteria bacterium 4484_255]|nr:MAG: hypothetical protein B6D52_03295 [Candidatus Parcubacteria bacterium 4484_255]